MRARLLSIAVLAAAGLLAACPPGRVQLGPQPGWNEYPTPVFFPLGFNDNKLDLSQEFYAGHRVRRFKLQLQFTGTSSGWPAGAQITLWVKHPGPMGFPVDSLVQTISSLPASATNGAFWTDTIVGNWVRIRVQTPTWTTVGNPTGVAMGRLLVPRLAVDWDASYANDYPQTALPSAGANQYTYGPLDANDETNSFFIGVNGPHYYAFSPSQSGTYAVYVSPNVPETGNDNGLVLGLSTSGFILPSTGTASAPGKFIPEPRDRGIYEEIDLSRGQTLYVTVRAVIGGAYTISVNHRARTFRPVVEFADGLANDSAPPIDLTRYSGTINWINLDGARHAEFIRSRAVYSTRMIETLVLTSANMLAASEGHLRLRGADIYLSEHMFLDADIFVHHGGGRATTSWTKINIYADSELRDPVKGGATLHHEWGHLEYDLEDEYTDLYPGPTALVADWNTVMGTSGWVNNIPAFEFCAESNHRYSSDIGEEDANWRTIEAKYGLFRDRAVWYSYPSSHGRYHDVLRKLLKLLSVDWYE